MKVLTYRVTLDEPALVTTLQGDPNSGVAFDYLPGGVLRGALIAAYLRDQDRAALDAADDTDRCLFLDGRTRYLNGYPMDEDGQRGLPVPTSWQQEKDGDGQICDFAVELPSGSKQWKGVELPFCVPRAQHVYFLRPEREVAVHTARTRRFGRAVTPDIPNVQLGPDELPGAVYRYDALARGQTFAAAILCEDDGVEAILRPLLQGAVTLGGSRSAGYGRARFADAAEAQAGWREAGGPRRAGGTLVVTLLSDALIRDDQGQYAVSPEVVTAAVERGLGRPAGALGAPRAFLRTSTVGGFNRAWGLPLPQALAAGMGSVLVFPALDAPADLGKLEVGGIGERRAEGFGRVACGWQTEPALTPRDPPARPAADLVALDADPVSRALAARMATRLLRMRLDAAVVASATAVTLIRPPSRAQLGRLRGVIQEELRGPMPGGGGPCGALDSVARRMSANRQFERARVGHDPLLTWLRRLLGCAGTAMPPADWRQLLGLEERDLVVRIGNVRTEPSDALRREYLLRYLDAVLAHAAHEGRKEGR